MPALCPMHSSAWLGGGGTTKCAASKARLTEGAACCCSTLVCTRLTHAHVRLQVMMCDVFAPEQCATLPAGPQQDKCIAAAKAASTTPPATAVPLVPEIIVEEGKVNLVAILVPACVGSAAVLGLVAYLTFRFRRYRRPSPEEIAAGKYDAGGLGPHAQLATVISSRDDDSVHGVAYATCLSAASGLGGPQRSFKLVQKDGCVALVPISSREGGGSSGSDSSTATGSTPSAPQGSGGGSPPQQQQQQQGPNSSALAVAALLGRAPQPSEEQSSAIQLQVQLGAGSFGQVFRGSWRQQTVAVKIIMHAKQSIERIRQEVDLMLRLDHANVVRALHYEVLDTLSALPQGASQRGMGLANSLKVRALAGGRAGGLWEACACPPCPPCRAQAAARKKQTAWKIASPDPSFYACTSRGLLPSQALMRSQARAHDACSVCCRWLQLPDAGHSSSLEPSTVSTFGGTSGGHHAGSNSTAQTWVVMGESPRLAACMHEPTTSPSIMESPCTGLIKRSCWIVKAVRICSLGGRPLSW